jgi:invasion protein IalB
MKHALGRLLATAVVIGIATAAAAQTVTGSKKFDDWQLDTYTLKAGRAHGVKSRDPGPKQAHVMQQYSWNADNKTVSLAVRVRFFDPRQATLMFILPPDTDKKSKVSYAIDTGPSATLQTLDCDNRICLATAALEDRLLTMLRGGTRLLVRYRVGGEPYAVPISLVGFTLAYAALEKTRTSD